MAVKFLLATFFNDFIIIDKVNLFSCVLAANYCWRASQAKWLGCFNFAYVIPRAKFILNNSLPKITNTLFSGHLFCFPYSLGFQQVSLFSRLNLTFLFLLSIYLPFYFFLYWVKLFPSYKYSSPLIPREIEVFK